LKKNTKDLRQEIEEYEKISDAMKILNRVCDRAIFVSLLLNTGLIPSRAGIFVNPLCSKKVLRVGSCRTLRIT
jgi:hypothetical protein